MAFMLSPGVEITEKDFTNIIPAVSTSVGAAAGVFRWGPVMQPTMVASENELVSVFGKPNDATAVSFFSAANFLAYANACYVTRNDNASQKNAVALKSGSVTAIALTEEENAGYTSGADITISAPEDANGVQATATATVVDGVITEIVITEAGSGYAEAPTVTVAAIGEDAPDPVTGATATVTTAGVKINNEDAFEALTTLNLFGPFAARYPGALGNSIKVSMCDSNYMWVDSSSNEYTQEDYELLDSETQADCTLTDVNFEAWAYADQFDGPAGYVVGMTTVDEQDTSAIHVIVIDENGVFTGTKGTVLETYAYASKAVNGKKSDGTNIYYKDNINKNSDFIYVLEHTEGVVDTNWGDYAEVDGVETVFEVMPAPETYQLSGGVDAGTTTNADFIDAFTLYEDAERYDISLVIAGKANQTVANAIIEIANARKDCVVFVSPENVDDASIITGTSTSTAQDIVDFRNVLPSTSYAVLDSGYKYQYDRYNDVYRWIPLNGDTAGLCARTDTTNDPWWSPGGYNRGQVKNVVKLAFNPNQTARDMLYKNGVNPVVSFQGQGTVLYGDKTLLAKPSAFDRINVRRLFIVLEKAIAIAAKYQLFEFNDEFTRAQFKSMVDPFLRDVQGRRGVYDFRTVCDETNNTGEVIDGNRFVADIYIKPARSINFISLNFIAVRTSVSFEEVGG